MELVIRQVELIDRLIPILYHHLGLSKGGAYRQVDSHIYHHLGLSKGGAYRQVDSHIYHHLGLSKGRAYIQVELRAGSTVLIFLNTVYLS